MKHILTSIIILVKNCLLDQKQVFAFATVYRDGVHYSQDGDEEGCCGGGCGSCEEGCECC